MRFLKQAATWASPTLNYYGRLKQKQPDAPLALFWPNQNDRGVRVNVSGASAVSRPRP